MTKKEKIFYVIFTIIILVLIGIIIWEKRGGKSNNYYAIYLNTGDMYFGKLVPSSRYTLIDPYFLRATQDKKNPLAIARFQNAFWKPGKKLQFNPANVVWINKLSPDSPIISFMESQKAGISAPTQTQTPQPSSAPNSSQPKPSSQKSPSPQKPSSQTHQKGQ